jgi:hypothetical protein
MRLAHLPPFARNRHGSLAFGYKGLAPITLAPKLSMPRHHRVATLCTPEPREREPREEGGKERNRGRHHRNTFGAAGAEGDAVVLITVAGSALHGFRSYTATTRHCTTILSPSTPTVSRTPLRPLLAHGFARPP